ncbi:hypothetical protein Xcel_3116 [Xylanimonas cellulosilytica DSM 15894]|uniref:DUF3800 domain-containing protein n=1 Tax=Xylanimonas cellulosilytica (strain DSM 15894 / JCM 12276 / CECT 5975 / KCTC 9989 / LMG 20990 / NBRC 107835 / XIL07) TaxID=446471 RepID=D1BZY9_XYLCX|nr:DUF3800 domain-containing protein [Xylanimonas cellulosilytica]ACZ32117.1 hypothetical protein Xcel_3116 [Xylanimonas cellulosilytica DSM 15894]
MLFAYVDETANQAHYRAVALVVPEAKVGALTQGLDDVVESAAKVHEGVAAEFELHGHDVFQATEEWSVMKRKVRARIAIYRQSLEVVASTAEAIYVEGLDRGRFRDRYADERDEHQTCLLHLLEKINAHARRRGEHIVVVADEHNTALATQDALRRARREPIWGYRGRPDRLVDTIYFVSSAMSRPVQAVDMVAFLHQRRADAVEPDPRATAANDALWRVLADVPSARPAVGTVDARQPPPCGGG